MINLAECWLRNITACETYCHYPKTYFIPCPLPFIYLFLQSPTDCVPEIAVPGLQELLNFNK